MRVLNLIEYEDGLRFEPQHIFELANIANGLGQGRDTLMRNGSPSSGEAPRIGIAHQRADAIEQSTIRARRGEAEPDMTRVSGRRPRTRLEAPCRPRLIPHSQRPPADFSRRVRRRLQPQAHRHPATVKIVDRYLLRELIVPFLLGLTIFTSILLIVRILKLGRDVSSTGACHCCQVIKLFSFHLAGLSRR